MFRNCAVCLVLVIVLVQYATCAPLPNAAPGCGTNPSTHSRSARSPDNSVIEEPDIVACDHFFQWIKLPQSTESKASGKGKQQNATVN